MIKKSLIFVFGVFSIFLCSCSALPAFTSTGEAQKLAEQHFSQLTVECNGNTYAYSYPSIYQIKGVNISVQEDPLSKADEMNGIEWKGTGKMTCSMSRYYNSIYHTWSDWEDKNGRVWGCNVQKRNGKWTVNSGELPRISPQDRK